MPKQNFIGIIILLGLSSKETLKIASKITLLQNIPIFKMFFWKFFINMHLSKKVLRFNGDPFMTKLFRKAIMYRSKLKTINNKTKANEDWDSYLEQRNFCVN